MLITLEEARAQLPKVGDKLKKKPTVLHPQSRVEIQTAQPCTVVEVNPAGLWYRVRFDNGGTECYKVPEEKGGGRA